MNEINEKKQMRLTIIAVVTLLALIAGATYAYFAVGVQNNFGTSTINATADRIGTVTLNGSNATLNMSLSAVDMMRQNSNVTYYASSEGRTTTPTEEIIGVASVFPTDDTNYYHCSYTLEVTQSYTGDKNLYNIFVGDQQVDNQTYTASENELILTVNGTNYDLSDSENELPKEIDGDFYIKAPNEVELTAGLRLVNLNNKNQNMLAGSGVNISIGVKANTFSCAAEEEPVLTSRTEYWTYEGEYVTYDTASPKYTDVNKSQIPNDYYIKTMLTPATREEDIYEIQYDDNGETGHYGMYEGIDACEADMQDGDTCVKLHSAGETYYVPTENEVCVKINNNEVCMEPNHWETADETYKSVLENAGWQCTYYDYDINSWGPVKPRDGYLICDATDPAMGYGNGTTYCEIYDAQVICQRDQYNSCEVSNSATCGYFNDSPMA